MVLYMHRTVKNIFFFSTALFYFHSTDWVEMHRDMLVHTSLHATNGRKN